MALTMNERLAGWATKTRQAGYRRRNWPVVRRLAAVTVVLLLASLPAEFVFSSRALAAACWAGAAVSGVAMLAWFLDRRLFVEQPPIVHR